LTFEEFDDIINVVDTILAGFSEEGLGLKTKEELEFIFSVTRNEIMVGDKILSIKYKRELAEKKYLEIPNVTSPQNRTTTAVLTLNDSGELKTEFRPIEEKKVLNMTTTPEVADKVTKKVKGVGL
jgi:hypothetical protein